MALPIASAYSKFSPATCRLLLEIAGLDRERDVFIANVLKCRPPSNRDPKAEEIEMCSPFLRDQTRTIDPQMIVTLGNFATRFILKTEVGITQLHGKVQHAGKFTVFPIYHPAAAIYDRKKQDALEEDFATLGRILNEMSASTGVGAAKPLEQGDGAIEEGQDEAFDPVAYINDPAWHSSCYGLERIESLLDRMGCPQDKLKFVHVAGTNGKGSTCAFTAGILQAAGYKVGLFTSPYVLRFNERIQVNREDISDEDLLAVALEVREAAEQMDEQPTAFELITAAALLHFAQVDCTAVVLEVGLGGRLDSTNVVVPEVCAITSIALDHTHVLGDTIAKIAHEKAGIIKAGIPVVSYKQKPEAEAVIMQRVREVGAPVSVPRFGRIHAYAEGLHQVFSYDGFTDVRLKLAGTYQPNNAVMAVRSGSRRGCGLWSWHCLT